MNYTVSPTRHQNQHGANWVRKGSNQEDHYSKSAHTDDCSSVRGELVLDVFQPWVTDDTLRAGGRPLPVSLTGKIYLVSVFEFTVGLCLRELTTFLFFRTCWRRPAARDPNRSAEVESSVCCTVNNNYRVYFSCCGNKLSSDVQQELFAFLQLFNSVWFHDASLNTSVVILCVWIWLYSFIYSWNTSVNTDCLKMSQIFNKYNR